MIEPLTVLTNQTLDWSLIFGLLCAGILICGFYLWKSATPQLVEFDVETADSISLSRNNISFYKKTIWVGLAAVPSGLLVSVTAFITTDVVSAPFMWILPLALFLLTFVITFQKKPIIPHKRALQILAIVVAPLSIVLFIGTGNLVMTGLHLFVFFVSALVCHAELVKRRPGAENLTQFYLWMSFGGVLGGMATSLIAPNLFSNILEYPIFLVLVFFCRPGFWKQFAMLGKGKYWIFIPSAFIIPMSIIAPGLISTLASSPIFALVIIVTIISQYKFAALQTALIVFGISVLFAGGLIIVR